MPLSRMLKKSASGVLASFRPSTYRKGYASALRSLRPCWTAFLSILQEYFPVVPHVRTIEILACQNTISAAALSSLGRERHERHAPRHPPRCRASHRRHRTGRDTVPIRSHSSHGTTDILRRKLTISSGVTPVPLEITHNPALSTQNCLHSFTSCIALFRVPCYTACQEKRKSDDHKSGTFIVFLPRRNA